MLSSSGNHKSIIVIVLLLLSIPLAYWYFKPYIPEDKVVAEKIIEKVKPIVEELEPEPEVVIVEEDHIADEVEVKVDFDKVAEVVKEDIKPIVVSNKNLLVDKYDDYFKAYSERYLPQYSYLWLKSICVAESNLKPNAVSPVGAMGLCQFMPGTWSDVLKNMGLNEDTSVWDAKFNIMASAYYMSTLAKGWSSNRPMVDRKKLSNASYNAGMGNLLKAQTRCNGAILYNEIIVCLPAVTGRFSEETMTYVERIYGFEEELRLIYK